MPFPYPKIIGRETAPPCPDFYRYPMPDTRCPMPDAQCPMPYSLFPIFNSFAMLSVFYEPIATISELLDKQSFPVLQILIG